MKTTTSIRWLILGLVLLGGPSALAQEEASQAPTITPEVRAEAERLSDDLEKLAKRQVWSGVEKKFRDLEALGAPLSLEDYLYGAYSARELGDVSSAYVRLQAAARLGGSKEIVDWLWDIDHNYGNVDLLMVPPRPVLLEVEEMPLDPNQRKAVEAAMRASKSNGTYRGLLPRGNYRFAGQPFSAEPGVSVRIEVNPKVRKHGPAAPVYRYPQSAGQNTPTAATPATGAPAAPEAPATPAPEEPQPQEQAP